MVKLFFFSVFSLLTMFGCSQDADTPQMASSCPYNHYWNGKECKAAPDKVPIPNGFSLLKYEKNDGISLASHPMGSIQSLLKFENDLIIGREVAKITEGTSHQIIISRLSPNDGVASKFIWETSLESVGINRLGGLATSTDGIIVVGTEPGTNKSTGQGTPDAFAAYISAVNGKILWKKALPGDSIDEGRSVVFDELSKKIYVAGNTRSSLFNNQQITSAKQDSHTFLTVFDQKGENTETHFLSMENTGLATKLKQYLGDTSLILTGYELNVTSMTLAKGHLVLAGNLRWQSNNSQKNLMSAAFIVNLKTNQLPMVDWSNLYFYQNNPQDNFVWGDAFSPVFTDNDSTVSFIANLGVCKETPDTEKIQHCRQKSVIAILDASSGNEKKGRIEIGDTPFFDNNLFSLQKISDSQWFFCGSSNGGLDLAYQGSRDAISGIADANGQIKKIVGMGSVQNDDFRASVVIGDSVYMGGVSAGNINGENQTEHEGFLVQAKLSSFR